MDDPQSHLFESVMTGNLDMAREALAAGADVRARNRHGIAPIHICAGGVGPAPMLALLLEAGAEADVRDATGWTPLIYVASSGQAPLLELLLGAGCDVDAVAAGDPARWTPLTRAAYRGHAHAVRRLLDAGADHTATAGVSQIHGGHNDG
jgi:ankyrin repeat protein